MVLVMQDDLYLSPYLDRPDGTSGEGTDVQEVSTSVSVSTLADAALSLLQMCLSPNV